MIVFSTQCVNTMRNIFLALFVANSLCIKTFAANPDQTASEVQIDLRTSNLFETRDAAASNAPKESQDLQGRRIQILQMNPLLMQFQFPKFSFFWLTSENQFKNFWIQNSKVKSDAPKLNIDWKTDSILAIFWESKDGIVRIPTYMGSEETDDNGAKDLKLLFGQNTPCLGIVTSLSPALFLIVDRNFSDLSSITLKTESTKSTGCY